MFISILIFAVFAIAFFLRKEVSPYYRTFSLSLFGIAFFSVWQPLQYYLSVTNQTAWLQQGLLPALIVVCCCVLLLPSVRRVGVVCTSITTVLFFSSAIIFMLFDYQVKNLLAERAGYFQQELPEPSHTQNEATLIYKNPLIGVQLNYPKTMRVREQQETFVVFESVAQADGVELEMLANCFHGSSVPVTEVVAGFKTRDPDMRYGCQDTGSEGYYLCTLTYSEEEKNIWRYLAFSKNTDQRVEVQFRSELNRDQIRGQVWPILNTIRVVPIENDYPQCVSSIEWF